jgi:hypothetical protein
LTGIALHAIIKESKDTNKQRKRDTEMATSFYETYAALHIGVDETESGELFCTIPSEKDVNVRYRLECKESSVGVEVLSCGCPSRKPCKHIAIVEGMWSRLYRSNVEKAVLKQEAEVAAKHNAEVAQSFGASVAPEWFVELVDEGTIVAPSHVEMVVQPVAPKVETVAPIEGQVWVEEIRDWAFLPSEEPVDHFTSLKGTRVGQRQEKESLMAQTRAENKRIKARRILAEQELTQANDDILERHAELMRAGAYTMPLGELNGAQQSATRLMELPSRRTA